MPRNESGPLDRAPAALREAVGRITRAATSAGGRPMLVGGCVRNALLGEAPREIDLEVHGLGLDRLERVVRSAHPCRRVGRSFEVIRVTGFAIDVSAAPDSVGDEAAALREAAARRDFTINAIAVDPADGRWFDPFDGRDDLATRRLRHTSPRFAEDPLRVLRGMQLVARYRLDPAPETVALCATLSPVGLPRDRIFHEWRRLIVEGVEPGRGLRFLADCSWLRHYPELEALVGCSQDPRWHPEGDVWTHTLHCMDAFARDRLGDAEEDLIVGLATLCHDLGKPLTTSLEPDGHVRAIAHDMRGVDPARNLLARITDRSDFAPQVTPLVAEHLRPMQLHAAGAGDAAIRRLARRVGRIDRLVRVARADHRGRPPLDDPFEAGAWLLAQAARLRIERRPPEALVRGRDLLALGATPGPALGRLLERCFEAQLEGRYTDLEGGIAHARRLLRGGG